MTIVQEIFCLKVVNKYGISVQDINSNLFYNFFFNYIGITGITAGGGGSRLFGYQSLQ